jgi:tight adherence protein C
MVFLPIFVIFVGTAALVATIALRVWVRPKEAIERITGAQGGAMEQAPPKHPSLVFHELVQRLGAKVPMSPKDVGVIQRRMIRAGIRGEHAPKTLYGCKLFCVGILPVLTWAATGVVEDPTNRLMAVAIAAAAGWFGPNEYVQMLARSRQKQIRRGLPNALDLLVICVESGLGLDQAIMQVSKELDAAHPEISEEFGFVNLELKAGKRRAEALRNLAERTSVDDLKKLVAVLIQADRFGTGVAQSLRAHADYMRVQARQIAEEKAAKLGVKLVFPIFFCILPTLFVITVGPVVIKIIRELLPMMNNM